MGTISLTLPVTGTVITAGLHSTNYTTLQNAINGGLDNNNINASAAIAQSKLAFDAWQTYTPAWTTGGSAPSLGNGTLTGRYAQVGKTVHGAVALTMGSTTTFGTGAYFLSLPVTASANVMGAIGLVDVKDASPAADYIHAAVISTTTTFALYSMAAPAAAATNTAPITFASGDIIYARFSYEAA